MKRTFLVICLLVVCLAGVSALSSDQWLNVMGEGTYSFNKSYGKPISAGADFSYYTLYEGCVGFYERVGILAGISNTTLDLRVPVSAGIALSTVIAGGVSIYAGIGPVWTFTSVGKSYKDEEQQLGAQVDLGFRFRLTGGSGVDMALVAGVIGSAYFVHIVNYSGTTPSAFSADVSGYVGVSFGFSDYGDSTTLLDPVVYY